MTTINELKNMISSNKVSFFKNAWARDYVSRKSEGYVEKYKGRYGEGYVWHQPSWDSTQYHIVSYYIFNNSLAGWRVKKSSKKSCRR